MILTLLVGLSLTLGSPRISLSAPRVTCSPTPDFCAASIKKGEVSPLTGQVITSSLAVSLAQRATECKQQCAIKLEQERTVNAIGMSTLRATHAADMNAITKERDLLRDQVHQAVPWYKTPVFVAGTTTIVLLSIFFAAR